MQYIIMCGGTYKNVVKALLKVNGEFIVERTIRLLREQGITDIAISTNNDLFEMFDVPILHHENNFNTVKGTGYWVEAFYPTHKPVCYLFGDVYYSPEAIHTIIGTWTNDIEFFASARPFASNYPKRWAEPFAFKVANQKHFQEAVDTTKRLCSQGAFKRHPIAWELWQVIKGTELNKIDTNYTVINDYTCDVDCVEDTKQWQHI